jgi:hypothetical protein
MGVNREGEKVAHLHSPVGDRFQARHRWRMGMRLQARSVAIRFR